ncbi:MAG TPA: hypothetical protein VHE37_11095, partial [Nevskiaceae bacterium]|nr:hypothetical protein [Nevskiaceae bacterium]
MRGAVGALFAMLAASAAAQPPAAGIGDDDLVQMQQAAAEYLHGNLLQVGAVSPSCRCEDGTDCSASVPLVYRTTQGPRTLQLVKVRERWQVSALDKAQLALAVLKREYAREAHGA